MNNFDPYKGALKLNDDLTLPYIWSALHLSTNIASQFDGNVDHADEISRMQKSNLFLLEALRAVHPDAWAGLCNAAGWTWNGAIALSWCPNVTLAQIGQCLAASGVPPTPGAAFEHVVSYLNPDLRPNTGELTEIMRLAENDTAGFCIGIVATEQTVISNLPHSSLANAPTNVLNFLSTYAS